MDLQGRDGFLVTTSGPPLTQVMVSGSEIHIVCSQPQAQIEDLKISSREYEEKQSRIAGELTVFVNKPIAVHQRLRRG